MCYKISKQSEWGTRYKVKCLREDYKDGLCYKHWKALKLKMTPWGERKTYKPAEDYNIRNKNSLKLKTERINNIYRFNNNIVQIQTKDYKWIDTNITPDISLFCVKM